jgi:hypothetical protein
VLVEHEHLRAEFFDPALKYFVVYEPQRRSRHAVTPKLALKEHMGSGQPFARLLDRDQPAQLVISPYTPGLVSRRFREG